MEEKPQTEERPESEPTSLEDGRSTSPGEGPRDQHPELEQLHGIPGDRDEP